MTSLVTAVVLVFLICLPVYMYDASIKLKVQSEKAIEQAEIAKATTEFITTLLKSATPLVNKGEDLNMVDVMQQAEQKLLTEPINNPQVEINLYRIFASIQHNLENNSKSIEHYQKAANLSAQIGDYEGQLSALGQKAVMHFFNNEVEPGNETFRQADEVSKKVNNAVDHTDYAYLLAKVAELHFNQGEYIKAEQARIQANEVFKKFKGPVSFQHAFGINALAEIHENQGKLKQAKTEYLNAISIRRKLDANNLIRIADIQKNLARLLVKTGDYLNAEKLIDQTIAAYQQYNKDNLYNHITKAAVIINDGYDKMACQSGIEQLAKLIPELEKKPKTNWQPMQAEIWIGELAAKCGHTELAQKHLNSGLKKSKQVYKTASIGQKLITEKVTEKLNL